MIDEMLDFRLLNDFQRDFPLCSAPFAELASRLGVAESAVLRVLEALRREGKVARVGAVFAPKRIGASTLAAMAVPPEKLAAVAEAVNRFPEVNHNYEREHRYNLWFVVTAGSEGRLQATLGAIAQAAGYPLLPLPLLQEYHIDLGFSLDGKGEKPMPRRVRRQVFVPPTPLDEFERRLVIALQEGLPLFIRPFSVLACRVGCDESEVLERIRRWCDEGIIKRFGVIVRHHELGYTANAMLVHDVPDEVVGDIGESLARETGVTLCYQRPRVQPDWPYNLFCMIHGQARAEVAARIAELRARLNLRDYAHAILFSLTRFKQVALVMHETARIDAIDAIDAIDVIDVIDVIDGAIIDCLQGGFPICERPYAEVASRLGISEDELLERLQRMLDTRVLTRFGPLFQVERMGGAFVLAAMCVPEADWQRVVEGVNAFPEVAHNYRRESERNGHNCRFNMWFVLATETTDGIQAVIRRIEEASGLPVFSFPKLKEYFVEMKLSVRA